jgi:hypothetical protein
VLKFYFAGIISVPSIGSGARRPKNMRTLRIRIQFRIRIPNIIVIAKRFNIKIESVYYAKTTFFGAANRQ